MFVCYAHRDSETVYTDLTQLDQLGIKLWYDEGIPAGSTWRAEIASAIRGATKLVFFISEASLESTHCLREVDYALSNDIEIVPVYLDDIALPEDLQLVLNRVQALFRKTDSLYMQHLGSALQNTSKLTPFGRTPKKKRFSTSILLLSLLLALGLPTLFFLLPWGSSLITDQLESKPVTSPNAYNQYLEGIGLLERWDKDDNLDKAIGLFREASELDPNFALAYASLANGLRIRYALTREENWLDEASAFADEAVRLNPGLAPVQIAIGRIHMTRGNVDLAFAALQRAVAIDPNNANANQNMARVFEQLGRMEDAEASLKKAVSLDQEGISAHNAFAHFLLGQGRFEEAIEQWRIVIRLAPDNFAALVNLGSAFSDNGQIEEAITVYQQANEIRPTYMAYSNLGTAYSRREQYPQAVDAYREALAIDDKDWLAWGNLAIVYSWIDPTDQRVNETFEHAIQLAESARQQSARDPYIYSDLALYYAKTGRSELSLQRIGTATTLAPDSGEIQAAAAEVYELLGQREKAIELVRKSIELGYSAQNFEINPELVELLNDLHMQETL